MASYRPLMRDYKPVSAKAQPRARWLVWFIAGLGLPLITVALISPDNSQPPQLEALTTVATVNAIPDETPEIIVPAPAKPKYSGEIPALVAAPEPEYERTVMTVKNGDSLDRLFRRNGLSVADLTVIMRDDQARKHLRVVKPGDKITVPGNFLNLGLRCSRHHLI